MSQENLIYVLLAIVAVKMLLPLFKKQENTAPKQQEKAKQKDSKTAISRFIALWPDTLTIPLILLVIAAFVWALTTIIIPFTGQENVRLYTWEDAQGIMYGLGAFFIASFFAFYWLRLNFKAVFTHYSSGLFKEDFNQLTPYQRWVVLLSLLALVFYVLTHLLQVG